MMCQLGWRLFSLFLVFMCIVSLQSQTANAFNFHRKLSRTSPIFERLNQRVDKRAIHNLSLLRLGNKLFRTEQPQVKRLMPDPVEVEYQIVERPQKPRVPMLYVLFRGNQMDEEYQQQ
ncbi:hypothetical protein M3Y97_00707900 [Aphelenchoides bicaudatus]|nr:hypothetical protein M3Y97_00707900 [Aphelenchoides bicaudatus]